MKTPALLALALWLAAAPVAALAHGDIDAKHGGITKMQNDLGFELVPQPDGAAIYIEDHGKPVPVAGMSGRLTVLNGSQKTEADLVPAGDRLEARAFADAARPVNHVLFQLLAHVVGRGLAETPPQVGDDAFVLRAVVARGPLAVAIAHFDRLVAAAIEQDAQLLLA